MTRAGPTAARLLESLEDFAEREAILLRVGDYAGFAAIRKREAPLIVRLCELASEVDTPALAGPLAALMQRRRRNLSLLQERTCFIHSERRRLAGMQERLRLVSPYGRSLPAGGEHAAGNRRAARLNAAV
jgi:hypothetical protein